MTTLLDLTARRHESRVLGAWLAGRPGAEERAGVGTVSANLEAGSGPITQAELAASLSALPSSTGIAVGEGTARRVSAVWACVDRIAGAILSLPLTVYERTPEGRSRVDHPHWWLLNEQATENMTSATWWEWMVGCLLLQGDAFADIVRPGSRTGRITELVPYHPSRVRVEMEEDDSLVYFLTDLRTGTVKRRVAADVLHIPGLFFDGKRGLSVLRAAALDAVGIGAAASEFSGRFFANGARPGFALTTESKLTADQIDVLRTSWMQSYAGSANAHKPLILSNGLKVDKLSIDPVDAMLLETRKFQVEEIARIFGVPPHMIGHTTSTTSWGTGIEQQSIGFVKYTLQRHLVKIEQEINRKFWPTRDRFFVEFQTAGLERGDIKTRNESYRIALGRAGEPGWMAVNEVRRLENLPPIDGADLPINPAARAPAPAPALSPSSGAAE